MKKKKIAGVNFMIAQNPKGLFFEMDGKDDVKQALKLGANKMVDEILYILENKFGKGQFIYKGGKSIEHGMQFNYTPGKLIDRL